VLKEENEEAGGEDAGDVREDSDSEDDQPPRLSTSTNQAARTSKFFEGSMNERSFGIASSWFHEVQSDSDKPLPPTPATKHVTFSCTPVRESPEDKAEHAPDLPTSNKRKSRRGLRKSISNFSFQTLSEKIRIFATHEPPPMSPTEKEKDKEEEKGKPKSASKPHLKGADILSERKRKADEAYALQFGFKKARPTGAPPPSSSTAAPAPLHASSTSISFSTSSSSSTSTTSSHPHPNLRKKKSRRELERENAELRARLDAQLNAQSVATTAAGAARPAGMSTTTASTEMGGGVDKGSRGTGKGNHEDKGKARGGQQQGGDVLRVMENGTATTAGKGDGKAVGGKVGNGIGVGSGVENNAGLRKSFEWPEDCF
jgi:hypothetical protein